MKLQLKKDMSPEKNKFLTRKGVEIIKIVGRKK